MNRISTTIVLILAFVMITFGQETDIRTVNGTKYIAHEVSAGETLWAISQRYNTDVQEIIDKNPGSSKTLSIGQVLLIPYGKEAKKQLKNDPPRIENGDILHTVKKGETLFSLYKRYNVEVNDLIEANPSLNDGLKLGMTIRIPMDKVRVVEEAYIAEAIEDGSLSHQIQAGETIYGISKQYGIEEKELLNANGGLPNGLAIGAFLKIPLKKEERTGAGSVVDNTATVIRDTYRVAYLLPFRLEDNDSLMSKSSLKGQVEFLDETEAALHFYFGSQLALQELEESGVRADVHIKEMDGADGSIKSILTDPDLDSIDLYLGPFHKNALEPLVTKALGQSGHVVCPTPQSNKVVLGNANLSKVLTTGAVQIPFIARNVVQEHYADNIIMMEAPVWKELDMRNMMRNALNGLLPKYIMSRQDSVLSCTIDKNVVNNLLMLLDPEAVNVLVVPTDEVYYSSELMTRLSKLDDELQIVVYGMQSWLEHENIDAEYKNRFQLHLPSCTFIDLNEPSTRDFVLKYRDTHGIDPNKYAYLGYDITQFYLSGLSQFGTGFYARLNEIEAGNLHMEFSMRRTGPENGYLNEHLYMLQYKDFELIKSGIEESPN